MSTDYELRERIEAISAATGDEDDLLTVAIPPDTPVGELLERVEEDHAEAEYIDSDEASKARRAVLERAVHLLHDYDVTPENGLVLYVGAVEGEEALVEYVFDDLPGPVEAEAYEWANEFDPGALETASGASATYGLVVVERGGAAIGRLEGDRVEAVETIESEVMGKTKAGGQSADRFERDRDRQKEEFFQEVADEAERAFLEDGDFAVDGLLVGGTTVTVDQFTDGDYLDHRLRDATVGGAFSVEYASEQGLQQLAEKGRDAVADAEEQSVRETLERFREALHEDGEVVYGEELVDEALEYDAVETLLVSGNRGLETIHEYEERAAGEGGEVVVVPPENEEGARFDETFGVAALLRFPVD
jgi:peptide chain release factor subunit 1